MPQRHTVAPEGLWIGRQRQYNPVRNGMNNNAIERSAERSPYESDEKVEHESEKSDSRAPEEYMRTQQT